MALTEAGIALPAAGVGQTVLAFVLDKTRLADVAFGSLLKKRLAEEGLDNLADQLGEGEAGKRRMDAVERIGSLASQAAAQLVAMVQMLPAVFLLWGVMHSASDPIRVGYAIASVALLAGLITLCVKLARGTMRDYNLHGPDASRRPILKTALYRFRQAWLTPGVYGLLTLLVGVFFAVAGAFFA
jgi:hypothetical protein